MLPYVMALLTTGLERSFQLAESLEARGFGNVRSRSAARDVAYKALTLLGLAGLLSGGFVLTYFTSYATAGGIATGLSVALLVGLFWAQGRQVMRVHYRRDRWTWRDGGVLALLLAVVALLGVARVQDPEALYHDPYSRLLPPFEPTIGLALAALAIPSLFGAGPATLGPAPREAS
jgi:hypothetical protein